MKLKQQKEIDLIIHKELMIQEMKEVRLPTSSPIALTFLLYSEMRRSRSEQQSNNAASN